MGDFGADTLRDSIESGWAFTTGRISKTATASMKETVQFFAHNQLRGAGEYPKAIEVQKILDPQTSDDENVVSHERWREVRHVFTITAVYRILSIEEILWDQAEEDIEDMCKEVIRIIKTIYDPPAETGSFLSSDFEWRNDDDMTTTQQSARRVLTFTLTELVSRSQEVYRGYGGVLTFDTSASTADSKPVGDYIYTEAHHVGISEGNQQSSRVTRLSSAGKGIAIRFRGKFGGSFRADIYAKKSDVSTATIEALDNIYKAQNNGELATCVFFHANDNTESSPSTMTTTTTVNITEMNLVSDDQQLVVFHVTGDIISPTTYGVA
jgi:hypothetical protein